MLFPEAADVASQLVQLERTYQPLERAVPGLVRSAAETGQPDDQVLLEVLKQVHEFSSDLMTLLRGLQTGLMWAAHGDLVGAEVDSERWERRSGLRIVYGAPEWTIEGTVRVPEQSLELLRSESDSPAPA